MITREAVEKFLTEKGISFDVIENTHPFTKEPIFCLEVRKTGHSLGIEFDDEVTIFFAEWHAHYINTDSMEKCFYQNLGDIIENRACATTSYVDSIDDDNWCCCSLPNAKDITPKYLKEEYGEGKIITCNFYDDTLDQVYYT